MMYMPAHLLQHLPTPPYPQRITPSTSTTAFPLVASYIPTVTLSTSTSISSTTITYSSIAPPSLYVEDFEAAKPPILALAAGLALMMLCLAATIACLYRKNTNTHPIHPNQLEPQLTSRLLNLPQDYFWPPSPHPSPLPSARSYPFINNLMTSRSVSMSAPQV